MGRALCISATFLTGRYHGAEWPPSPARLLQALVAGVSLGGNRALRPRAEPALLWLERRPAPLILARPSAALQPYRLAVPNNDMDVVAREWAAGKPGDPSRLRTMKPVVPRSVEGPAPHVRYLWPLEDGEEGPPLADLQSLAQCLYSLGWGVDMAYADAELPCDPPSEGFEKWSPSLAGVKLPVPVPGFLKDLDETYLRFTRRIETMDTDTRPTVYRLQPYLNRETLAPPYARFALRALRSDARFSHPWHRAMEVAAWLRHASGQALRDLGFPNVDQFVLGHPSGRDASADHMSFLSLPSVVPGFQHADGRISRVLLAEPIGSDGSAVDLLGVRLMGEVLTREGRGDPVCTLAPLPDDRVFASYTGEGRVWRSVTPVVLHGYNSNRGRVSLSKTENLLLRAFAAAGHDAGRIDSLAFQPAPLWPNTGAAAAISVPRHLDGYPRYHVEVRFRRAVTGPVLAGIGRHYGIGLFAASGDS